MWELLHASKNRVSLLSEDISQGSLGNVNPLRHTWPVIERDVQEAALKVLQSGKINYWTGQEARLFEQEYAAYLGVPYALAVSNGTLALELALRAAGVGEGDEVIVPSRTFIATAGCVAAVGATPVVADIDPATNNMTALSMAEVMTPRTRAVIVVHLGGYPAPLEEICGLAAQINAVVIEDCAQAHGATYRRKMVGSLGDAGCFSFCQDKILPLGEGGMITFKDKELFERAWSYRDHGRSFEKTQALTVSQESPEFKWLTDSFGSNARMGEIEGAMGRVLLRELENYHEVRTMHALKLAACFDEIEGITPLVPCQNEREQGTNHAFYRLYARINTQRLKPDWSRDRIIKTLNEQNIAVQYGSCALIGREKAFERFADAQLSTWPGAWIAHRESIAFMVHPTLTDEDISYIAQAVRRVMQQACAPADGVLTFE